MAVKRMRVFAGPNGSGKTTIVNRLRSEIGFGVYVNADDIERTLAISNVLLFSDDQLNINEELIQNYFRNSSFSPQKRNEQDLWSKLKVIENVLRIETKVDSYLAADLAEFIRQQLLMADVSFTYETVMSHQSKMDFLKKAQEKGYRVYLYFIATEYPEINISRVNIRVAQKGHFVSPETITDRYYKSLNQLKSAIKLSNRAYLWDNSSSAAILFAEITDGNEVAIIDPDKVPNWFLKHVVQLNQ
jgi:predicted ABC-type ATPase